MVGKCAIHPIFAAMPILLCAATEIELAPLRQHLQNSQGIEWFITGVGLMQATFALTKQLGQKKYDWVVQAGVAGSLDPGLSPGTVVTVASEQVGDLGVEEEGRFRSLFRLNLAGENNPPFQAGRLYNPYLAMLSPSYHSVHAVSVSEITTSDRRALYYAQTLGAAIESMEGAALHYVCLQEGQRFLQVRALSNFVGERNKALWQMDKALHNLALTLSRLLPNLQSNTPT